MKHVNLRILVPSGKYCWDGAEICEHFDNEGGHSTCNLRFYDQGEDKAGHVLKDEKCLNLEAT